MVPIDSFPCWIFSETERFELLKGNQAYHNTPPPCFFKLTQRLDNNFIQGHLGNMSNQGEFHENISDRYSYFREYQERKSVYFSFDRITLYRLIEIHPSKPLSLILKRLDNPKAVIKNRAFMIMPFRHADLNTLYKDHIKDFLLNDEELKIEIFRADDFNGNDIVIETIYNQLEQSEFVIADISHSNKNVFYELGWATAMNKEIITIQNKDIEENIFFDRAHIRTRLYSLDNISELQRQLKNDIIAIRDKLLAKN